MLYFIIPIFVLAINFTDDSDSLRTLVGRMDQILSEYQLPSFYKVNTDVFWRLLKVKFYNIYAMRTDE